MFSDEVKIKVVAGKGGDGCMSFRREKFIPKGGPDGGNGGRGGNVIVKASPHLNTLSDLVNGKTYKAENGIMGMGKNMFGRNGEHLIIAVPPGTVVFNADKTQFFADLQNVGEQIEIVRGGIGGKGNAEFVSSTHQAPKFAEKGEPGEELEIVLELKLVADVGIIGLPSAGKSTLISIISNAKPKIAAYHFTTLVPNLGVVDMKRFGGSNSFVVADIPGLIEGASAGKGLGIQFLKHISRTKILVHVLDATSEDLKADYKTVREELKKYDKRVSKKKEIIVLNKIDLLTDLEIKEKKKLFARNKAGVFMISAATTEGIQSLMFKVLEVLTEVKKTELEEKDLEEKPVPILRPHEDKEKFKLDGITVKEKRKIFELSGRRIEQLIVMTDISNPEGLERMYHYIEKLGIQELVEKKGATFGDFIRIKGRKIPYRK